MKTKVKHTSHSHVLSFRPWSALIAILFALTLNAQVSRADDAPAWLKQASSVSVSPDKNQAAVVLLSEQVIKVEEDGRIVTTERYAARITANEGRSAARGSAAYLTGSSKIREFKGWLVGPTGEVKKYEKNAVIDLAAAPNDVYNEIRVQSISAAGDCEPGSVFGYEWIREERSVFTQFDWQFQDSYATMRSSFSLTLPAGWRAESVTFNHPRIEPVVNGTTQTWELRNLPPILDEPASPPITMLAPRLAVSYFAGSGGRAGIGRSFDSWVDVSRWLAELSDPQSALDDTIGSKALQLAAGANSEYQRIQSIGRFVQDINYVAIQTGIGRGGGYRPHSASEVFSKAYGDCKDKANLMRTMLKALRIPSYLLVIYSGDPSYVREEWPSPQQFNHCIIAIKVSDETQAPTIVEHPTLGRLLIFDPTDDNTPVGDLPDHEQGSLALLVAGDQGKLLKMPVIPPERNKLERHGEIALSPDGSIKVTMKEAAVGHSAVRMRREFRGIPRPDYVKMIERWVSRGAAAAEVSKIEPSDISAAGKFTLEVEFSAPRYGQLMQGSLLVFKPVVVSRRESLFLTARSRKYPVVLKASAYDEKLRIKLPQGFQVDELPEAVKLETPFGDYSTSYEVKDGHLNFTRSLVVRESTILPADYSKVFSFFATISGAEQAPVVLARKN